MSPISHMRDSRLILLVHYVQQHIYVKLLLCVALGAISPLSFAPFDYWLVSLFSLAGFAALLSSVNTGKQFFILSFAFGLGYFGIGVSWVYVSIYHFGSAPFLLAILLTSLFVSFVALVFALPFYALIWVTPSLRLLLGIPLLWVFSEWIRTWLLTGFPWLFIGYSHTDTVLSGWAPIGGILLVSLLSLLTSSVMAICCYARYAVKIKLYAGLFILCAWLAGYALQAVRWTQQGDKEITVGIVQPNVHQNLRWLPEYQDTIKAGLRELSAPLWESDWIIWPEAAIPHVFHGSLDFIEETRQLAKRSNTTVITGVLYDAPLVDQQRQQYFNSIIGIGDSEGIYHKQRLVPFGEYVPLEDWIRGLIEFFNLPFSVISSGPAEQATVRIGNYSLANAICYEIAYPTLVAEVAKAADVLLTVSNDAWFGESIGPLQHFQMARMRAIEIGRYVIRGTNNGISAIIQPNGKVQQQSEQFIATTMSGSVFPMQGNTPFMRWKHYVVFSLLIVMFLVSYDRSLTRVKD
jgi:apolipoprotein N-acyltransferase